MSAIKIEQLTKTYGKVHALDGLDMQVEEGSIYGFLGPNGAGKTTTMRILTGLAKATGGKASVAGVDLNHDSRHLTNHIGYLPEEPAFYPWMTPTEFLDYLGRLYGLTAKDRASRTKELLQLVNLGDSARRRIGGFSRGMRQRLGLASALVNQPEVLLLDEPASALDPAGRKEVLEMIEGLQGKSTVLMSTHILADVERVCDVVVIMDHGKMLAQAPRNELLSRVSVSIFEIEAQAPAKLKEWMNANQNVSWLTSSDFRDPVCRLVVSDIAKARETLLPSLLGAGLTLTRYEELKPSLEDVFLRLVNGEEQS
jgi:ABC-2 type transport system ATP-binding protein